MRMTAHGYRQLLERIARQRQAIALAGVVFQFNWLPANYATRTKNKEQRTDCDALFLCSLFSVLCSLGLELTQCAEEACVVRRPVLSSGPRRSASSAAASTASIGLDRFHEEMANQSAMSGWRI